MARTLTLLHGADLHLGAPMRGVAYLSDEWRVRVLDAMVEALRRLVDAALRNNVDLVVLAGDVFDQAKPSLHDFKAFVAEIERLAAADIPVYLCGGNHDPFTVWNEESFVSGLPATVHSFDADRPSFFLYEREGEPLCVLAGRSYYSKIWPADAPIAEGLTRENAVAALGLRAAEAPFGVGVLHTGLDLDKVKAPSNRQTLARAGFNYWALGHLHRRWSETIGDTTLAFSGCTQGRDIRETGRRGVNLVTLVEGEAPSVRFVPTASLALGRLNVDVSLCPALSQVKEKIMTALFTEDGNALCERMLSRVTLTGVSGLHHQLVDGAVREELRRKVNESYDDFYCDAIIDQTTDPEANALVDAATEVASNKELHRWNEAADPNFAGTEPPLSVDIADENLDMDPLAGRFPELLVRIAAKQDDHGLSETAYLQKQFARYGLELDAPDETTLKRLALEARGLNLDLLDAAEEAAL